MMVRAPSPAANVRWATPHRIARDRPDLPDRQPLVGFTVCGAGLMFVAMVGCLAFAGWRGWVVEPGGAPIHGVSCGTDGAIYEIPGSPHSYG